MQYPAFYDAVPRIRLRDPLAALLGASDDGEIEYGYPDAVKLAGHSCPTVASAYWMTRLALQALYGDELPERGAIRVDFRAPLLDGVTGVIANVVSMLTGATHDTGFKGLAGRFDRRHLLYFAQDLPLDIRFTRQDNGAQVDVAAQLRGVPANPTLPGLLQTCLSGSASPDELRQFGAIWQDRVRRILLEHANDPAVFVVQKG